jgi:hypothetical protein
MDREQVQAFLEQLLGSRNVYFQPPANVQMAYPAIVYSRDTITSDHADDIPYLSRTRYEVTIIDRDPENPVIGVLAKRPLSSFSRHFVVDELNHDVFNIYF